VCNTLRHARALLTSLEPRALATPTLCTTRTLLHTHAPVLRETIQLSSSILAKPSSAVGLGCWLQGQEGGVWECVCAGMCVWGGAGACGMHRTTDCAARMQGARPASRIWLSGRGHCPGAARTNACLAWPGASPNSSRLSVFFFFFLF